ncbi:DNA polymerase V [Striga asiatica]|uniref:DNA polymerase V n=1 Tax=Striga asiatica TaxID=4170 RepID=A0A5A7PQB2_STRAF|nr:DNA polymerase V [Striga asiatica]
MKSQQFGVLLFVYRLRLASLLRSWVGQDSLDFLIDLCGFHEPNFVFGLFARRRQTGPVFATRLRGGLTIPNHPNYGKHHAHNNMGIKTFFTEEKKTERQDKNGLHVTQHLKRDSCESAYADELAKLICRCSYRHRPVYRSTSSQQRALPKVTMQLEEVLSARVD